MEERATSDILRFLKRESKKEGRKSNMRNIKILKKKMKTTKIQGSADALGN